MKITKYEVFGKVRIFCKVRKFHTWPKNSYFTEIFILYDFHTLPKKILYQKIHTFLKYSYLTENFENQMCGCFVQHFRSYSIFLELAQYLGNLANGNLASFWKFAEYFGSFPKKMEGLAKKLRVCPIFLEFGQKIGSLANFCEFP